jgi:hypothetical protein
MRRLVSLLALSIVMVVATTSTEASSRGQTRRRSAPARTAPVQRPFVGLTTIGEEGITVQYPDGWVEGAGLYSNATVLHKVFQKTTGQIAVEGAEGAVAAGITIHVEHWKSPAEAMRRLDEIRSGTVDSATDFKVQGWPAVTVQYKLVMPGVGERDDDRGQAPTLLPQPNTGNQEVVKVVTAIAADNRLILLDGTLPAGAPQTMLDEVAAVEHSIALGKKTAAAANAPQQAVAGGEPPQFTPLPPDDPARALVPADANEPGGISETMMGASFPISETEVTASTDGRFVVIAAQNQFASSSDGGQTFTHSGTTPYSNFGDASLAFGKSGTFYWANIHATAGCGNFGCATGVSRSTNHGQTFPVFTDAVVCPNSGASECFPDQEHIAADRFNSAPGGGDQVYSTWRNFAMVGQDPALVCSTDSGLTWTAPKHVGSGFVPRITVGQDGFVYVIYRSSSNIVMNKFSSCANGLVDQFGGPITIANVSDVACPVPGLDRCNNGNILSSHMISVDDTNANHIYVAYATNTSTGINEDVLIQDSTDSGNTWARPTVRLNTATNGRRFMPWVCTTGGVAQVAWYDRRAAVGGPTNDITDYFRSSASLNGVGTLVAGTEVKLTQNSDAQCASGWQCGVRSSGDSESCTTQPQLAGFCSSDNSRCDFSSTTCPAAGTCKTNSGCPKYGDYNGIGCSAGQLFANWASATPPPTFTNNGHVNVFMDPITVVNPPALSNRTFVSTNGSDSGNCNPGSPCRTFGFAMSQTNPGGEIVVLDTGGYGPVTINQTISIDSAATHGSITQTSGDAITIAAAATDVITIRGLFLFGRHLGSNGITVTAAGAVFVQDTEASGFTQNGLNVNLAGTAIVGVGNCAFRDNQNDGARFSSSNGMVTVYVHDTDLALNTAAGLEAAAGTRVSVAHASAFGNGTGFLSGVGAAGGSDLTLERVRSIGNGTGLLSSSGGGTATLRFVYSLVTQNTTGLTHIGSAALLGSSPADSVVIGNSADGTTTGSITMK